MDLEKVKQSYKWDPSEGDYLKSYAHRERKLQRKKLIRNRILKLLYLLFLIAFVILVYLKFQ